MSSSQGADAYMKRMANMQFQELLPGCEEGRGLPPQLPNSTPKFRLRGSWYLLASVVNTDVSTLDGAPLCHGEAATEVAPHDQSVLPQLLLMNRLTRSRKMLHIDVF